MYEITSGCWFSPGGVVVRVVRWYPTCMKGVHSGGQPSGAVFRVEPSSQAGQEDDERLIARAVGGSRDALAELYDRHAPLLLGLGARILGDRGLAEDVLHDVFLEAWHHAREYDPARGTVRAWLVTRMRSRSLDRRGRA